MNKATREHLAAIIAAAPPPGPQQRAGMSALWQQATGHARADSKQQEAAPAA